MDVGDLRIFEAVARLGGMNRAAATLHTVQSNVTARIRALEVELGTPLFLRRSSGVALTPAGRRLLPYARRAMALMEEAGRAVRDDGTPQGPLRIGSLETTAAVRLSRLLARYAADHPAVDLSLATGTSVEMVEAVVDGRLDGAFACGPVDHPELEGEVMFREELVIAGAPHRLLGGGSETLFHEPEGVRILVLRAGCSYRQRLEEILARRGVVGPRRAEFGTLDAIMGCCAAGLGITLLPRAVVEAARTDHAVALQALPPAEAWVETLFLRRRGAAMSSALAAFLDLVRRQATVEPPPVPVSVS